MKITPKAPVMKVETVKSVPQAAAVKPAVKKEAPKTVRDTFSVRAEVGSKVFVAGTFNHWDPTAKALVDKKGDGVYTATLNLPAGDHQYKFVIDGVWCADPDCDSWVQNEHGTINSVKHVS